MRTLVITGASRGIGLALVRECLLHGDRVAALARAPEDSPGLRELSRQYPRHLTPVSADVTDSVSLRTAREAIDRTFEDGLDILVNNAGTMLSRETPEVMCFDPAEMETVFRVNTVGPLLVTQAFLPLLRKKAGTAPVETEHIAGNGTGGTTATGANPMSRPEAQRLVVNVTSVMGSLARVGERRNYSYSVSKTALNMLTRLLHQDLQEEGIFVFGIHPGWVRTDMGGDRAHFSVDESAAGIYTQIVTRRRDDPELVDFRGRELPW